MLRFFFGESYGIIELLSRGIEVYQISANPILESYSKSMERFRY